MLKYEITKIEYAVLLWLVIFSSTYDFFSFCVQFFVNFLKFTMAWLPLESQQSIVEVKKVGLNKSRIVNIKEKDKKNRPKGLEDSHPEQ